MEYWLNLESKYYDGHSGCNYVKWNVTQCTAHQACERLSFLWIEVPFYRESVVYIFRYIDSSNLIENDHNFVFLTIKYQLSNTLSHVCFEKMPRNWENAHRCRALTLPKNSFFFYLFFAKLQLFLPPVLSSRSRFL